MQDATFGTETKQSMGTPYFTVATSDGAAVAEQVAVTVPLNQKALVPTSSQRVRRLRKHLVASLRALRTMKDPIGSASPVRPEPDGFVGRVARTACELCRGFCCKGGEEHAYLDERTMARVRHASPDLDARAILRLYLERVPASAYEKSCVFHAAEGCSLERSLRSDVCNSYFCNGLGNFVKGDAVASSLVIIAAQGEQMRISANLASASPPSLSASTPRAAGTRPSA